MYADEIPKNSELLPTIQANIALISKLLSQPKLLQKAFTENFQGDFSQFEKAEILAQKIESLKFIDDPAALKQVRQELAANIHARKLSVKRTGELLMALGYLKVCEEKDEVLSWLEKLIAQEPTSFVYYAKLAGYYHDLKMDDKALGPIQKALSLSQERQFLNLRLLAQIQKALNKKSEAIATISKAMALPEAKLEKYKKYADELSEMQKSLSQ
jgi:tetratricopeptide (TPR) repeat protein